MSGDGKTVGDGSFIVVSLPNGVMTSTRCMNIDISESTLSGHYVYSTDRPWIMRFDMRFGH